MLIINDDKIGSFLFIITNLIVDKMIFCYIIYIHPSERGRGVCGKGEM